MNSYSRRRSSDLDVIRREMDRLFSSFTPSETREGSPSWAPRADVVETDDAYALSMDLPGVDPSAVDVSFDDGTLKVSGSREVHPDHREGRFHRVERHYGQFFRSFQLGSDVDPDQIDASFEAGVLSIRVGKAEAQRPRQITIRTGVTGTSRPSDSDTGRDSHEVSIEDSREAETVA